MSEASYSVGIVGTGMVAQQIAVSLIERAFSYSSLHFLALDAAPGDTIDVEHQTFGIEPLDERARALEVIFLTAETAWTERDVETMVLAGATVIDCSGRYAREIDVPLVVPECNAEALVDLGHRLIVASPDTVAIALSIVLAPLHAQAGVHRAVATALEPVSEAGAAGIDELSRQTVDLLQGQSTEPEVFPARVSFNVLPRVGEISPSGESMAEEQSVWQIRRVLDLPELAISLSRACVPTFYGTGISLNVELETPMDANEAVELLQGSPGILVTTAEQELDLSVGDAVGQDATLVSRVRADRSSDSAINLWISIDNARKGSAVNCVQIAELVLRGR